MVVRVRQLWNKTTVGAIVLCPVMRSALVDHSYHWGIENKLHWVLDVTWQDASVSGA